MPSLRQLLRSHAPLLLIDAASTRVQVGLLKEAGRPDAPYSERWAALEVEAGVGIFNAIEQLAIELSEIRAFVFCEGPGSILGIRTAAMAIRTWQTLEARPAFAYSSLALVAEALGQTDAAIIADARRDAWHHQLLGGELTRKPTAELSGKLIMPENFRHWTPLPVGLERTPYDVASLFRKAIDAELLREVAAPDAFLHEEPSYATWTPHVHRAPTP